MESMKNAQVWFFSFAEADRDVLDWSGRKPLEYRKQSTSVSASTYSSKYGSTISLASTVSSASMLPLANVIASDSNAFGTLKLKRHKRYSTASGVLGRTQSMMAKPHSPDLQYGAPKRTTYFSPELDQAKRSQKRYRSILFRKKVLQPPKDCVDSDTLCA